MIPVASSKQFLTSCNAHISVEIGLIINFVSAEIWSFFVEDIFKGEITSYGIELVYTNNKEVVLSCTENNGKFIIYANKLFMTCTQNIALNVINYYVKNDLDSFNILSDFVKNIDYNYSIKNKKIISNSMIKGELKMQQIVMFSFLDESKVTLSPDQEFTLNAEDTVELDITVSNDN